jgi:ParB-like chromosome segregation protein Spo0J
MARMLKIAELLANGEQPFEPLDAETFDALAAAIGAGRRKLTVPIVLSARGRLLDGHQRLAALLRNGRKTLSTDDVRIDRKATDPEKEAIAAINYQRLRRQTTTADNAKVARQLMRRFGWSQGVVAEKLGVSQPAVSQWLRAHPDPSGRCPSLGATGAATT